VARNVRIRKVVRRQTEWWVVALRLTGLGWYVVVCILVGVLGGLWLDRRLGILPLFTLLGVLMGSLVAFWGIYRMVMPLTREKRNNSESEEKP
jgi:F0F1-type ATP synthase assembly protein I